jgi:hypothetical protein
MTVNIDRFQPTADRAVDRANTAAVALRMFDTELKNAMKSFKAHPTATYFNHLSRTMIVWQQFDQLQRKAERREHFNAFLDRVPSLPMGTWGDHACIFACGMTSKELMAIPDRQTQL